MSTTFLNFVFRQGTDIRSVIRSVISSDISTVISKPPRYRHFPGSVKQRKQLAKEKRKYQRKKKLYHKEKYIKDCIYNLYKKKILKGVLMSILFLYIIYIIYRRNSAQLNLTQNDPSKTKLRIMNMGVHGTSSAPGTPFFLHIG